MGILGKFFGPPNVDELKAKGNIKGLIHAFNSGDENIRAKAAEALADSGNNSATEFLYERLNDNNSLVVMGAIAGVTKLGDSRAFSALLGIFKEKKKFTLEFDLLKGASAMSLAKIGGTKALQPILEAIRRSNSDLEVAYDKFALKLLNAPESFVKNNKASLSIMRINLLIALVIIGTPEAISAMEELLAKEKDQNVLSFGRESVRKMKMRLQEQT